jgi:hypothetical protein
MRVFLALLGTAALVACVESGSRDNFSGEASRKAEQQAQEQCAADGKRAQLLNSYDKADGSRRFEYQCVQ